MRTDPHAAIISRRTLVLAGLAMAGPAWGAAPAGRRLEFAIFRNGTKVGRHRMSFAGEVGSAEVTTEVEMSVKLGPVPVFRYRHRALERWAGGRFSSLETTTDSNGKLERVSARRTDKGLNLETAKGLVPMPANALPFTHWNSQVYGAPLFNPQEGKLLRVTAVRKGDSPAKLANGKITNATLWSIRGEAEIDDWYDPSGVWTALSGKLKDGSMLEYRRV